MVKRALTLLTSILIALPLLMPFNIYANATHLVQTDYLSTVSSDWTNSMVFTSYCEGTNASTASCVLTVNITKSPKNYFGTVTIHGYDSSGTKWINYGDIFVSAGTGVYNYNFYQNGIKEISRVEVYSTNLIQPSSTVDLSQIISLLTSINNYEQSSNLILDNIEDNTLDTVNEIKNVISELIESNGYLETLTKLKQWNMPIESYPVNFSFFNDSANINKFEFSTYNYSYYNYPVIKPLQNNLIVANAYLTYLNNYYDFIIGVYGGNYNGIPNIQNDFVLNRGTYSDFKSLYFSNGFRIFKIRVNYQDVEGNYTITFNKTHDFILFGLFRYSETLNNNFSTDFALQFDYSNRFLDDIHLIANGTTASQSAADSSQSANEQLQTDSNTLFQQEDSFKSDMNNAMQNVNTTFRLQDMGTKFVSSAQWVRTQYEQLTNNTPFASLITFSLITGLALILLGKVYK